MLSRRLSVSPLRHMPGIALVASVLLLAGCAIAPDRVAMPDPVLRATREQAMNARWQNHTLSELVRERGEPRDTMNIPGGGNPPGFITVYERDPVSGCVDAFALGYGPEPVIRNYYCR
jgi:hypothetical protein